ncbi:unnamed protein product [Cunninghamella blakesleeana]
MYKLIAIFNTLFLLSYINALPHIQQQQPFQHNSFDILFDTLDSPIVEDLVYHTTDELLNANSIYTSCSSCISLLQMIKSLSYTSERFLIKTLTKVCIRTKRVSPEVCEGVMEEQVPIFRKVVKTMNISGRDGHLMCAAIVNSCPYPDIEKREVQFPKPKPKNIPHIEPSGETFTVLQLSDWHIDPEYEAFSDAICDKPICCRSSSTDYSNITKLSSPWGEYSCDTPLSLIESMLSYIPTVEKDISFGLMTGDIPPHEVWHTLPFLKTQFIQDGSYALLHAHFDASNKINSVLYPAVGNHESAPTNNFPLKINTLPDDDDHDFLSLTWLYKSLAKSWKGWLPIESDTKIESNTGSYVARPLKGLKLISLNTNFCYTLNWWLYQQPNQLDPNGILKWLVEQLQESEDIGERVWVIGHIAPGDSTCFHDYSNYYYQIIERYAPHVIAGQFFGHTHKDELQIFYKNGQQNASEAISVAYVAPSITPYLNVNPGFRTYKIDKKTFEVVDSITYIADLDKAEDWLDGPNWHVEYSAREAYRSKNAQLSSEHTPLTADWWHNVTVDMENNKDTFDKYWYYRTKLAPQTPECDEDCQKNTICSIRAGKSELRCDYDPDVLFGGGSTSSSSGNPIKDRYSEPHSCGWNLEGIRSLQNSHSLKK